MPSGGARPGSGRKKGVKSKLTMAREEFVAQQLDKARNTGRKLPTDTLEEFLEIAKGATGVNRPTSQKEINDGRAPNPDGDWTRFGEWFDRAVYCARELAKYREPQIRAVDAPAPPPDATEIERAGRKRFGLRVFEGGVLVEEVIPP
jgi:hypothetical protein